MSKRTGDPVITICGPGTIRVGSRRFTLAPLPVRAVKNEKAVLPVGKAGWDAGYSLKKTRMVYRCLVPGSVAVAGADGTVYKSGRDYRPVPDWPRVLRIAGGKIGPADMVGISYSYRLSRLDLVQVCPRGRYTVKTGRPDLTCPLPPRPDNGCRAVAGVYVAAHARRVRCQDILPIKQERPLPPQRLPETVLRKLHGKGQFTVIAFGDSITRGGDASTPARSWFGLFTRRLKKKYGAKRIVTLNAGIGGNTSSQGLARISRDVLRHGPDLVTIGFGVNDENGPKGGRANAVPLSRYRSNLEAMIRRIGKTGADIILLTPTPKNPGWEYTSGTIRRYAQTVRDLGRLYGVPVADMNRAWNGLKNKGIPYLTYLSTCINHPNDHGHRLMAGVLGKLFE